MPVFSQTTDRSLNLPSKSNPILSFMASTAFMSDSDEETMIIAHEQSLRCSSSQRRRPPYSKRRASRDSRPWPAEAKKEILRAHEQFLLDLEEWGREFRDKIISKADSKAEVMNLKQLAEKIVVKPMASTAFMSDSEEETMIIAHEQYIRYIQEAGRDKMTSPMILHQPSAKGSDSATDLEIQGRCSSQRRRPPHIKRRASRDSRPWPAGAKMKSTSDEEAMILQQPTAKESKSQDSATDLE